MRIPLDYELSLLDEIIRLICRGRFVNDLDRPDHFYRESR